VFVVHVTSGATGAIGTKSAGFNWFQLVSTGFSGLILLVFVSICSYLLVFVGIY